MKFLEFPKLLYVANELGLVNCKDINRLLCFSLRMFTTDMEELLVDNYVELHETVFYAEFEQRIFNEISEFVFVLLIVFHFYN